MGLADIPGRNVHYYTSCTKRGYTSGKPKAKEQPSVSYQDVEGESAGNLGGGSGKTDSDKGSDCSIAIENQKGDAQNLGGDSGKPQVDSMQTLESGYTAFTVGEFWTGSDATLDPCSENSNESLSKYFLRDRGGCESGELLTVLTEAAPLTAAAIGYDLEGEGSVGTEVAYWGDLVLVPHLINLLSKKSVKARLSFGQARNPQHDRKQEARLLHEEVCLLHRNLFYTRNV
jgi:hypothetical protein